METKIGMVRNLKKMADYNLGRNKGKMNFPHPPDFGLHGPGDPTPRSMQTQAQHFFHH